MALICLRRYFWDGPELYHDVLELDSLQSVANIRAESEVRELSFM
jgi:hypothetical protein